MKPAKSAKAAANGLVQLSALLDTSQANFAARNLKKALTTTQIALDFARQSGFHEDFFKGIVLLARIYSTNGRYLSDSGYFAKAHAALDEARKMHFAGKAEFVIEILRAEGEVFFNEGDFAAARRSWGAAFLKAKENNFEKQRIQLLAACSQAEMAAGNYGAAYEFAQQAYESWQAFENTEKDKFLRLDVGNQLAQVLIKKHDYSRALEISQELLPLSREQNDIEKELSALNTMAIVSGVKSNYKIAMQYFLEALDKSEKIGYRQNIAHCLINMGTIYAHLYNYEDALARYNEVLMRYKDTLQDYTKVVIFNNVGNIRYTTGHAEAAMEYFEKALELAAEKDFKEEVALAMAQLGRTHTALGHAEKALQIAGEAQTLLEETGTANGLQINLLNLGDIYFRKNELEKAENFIKKGIEAALKLSDDAGQIRGYHLLSSVLKAKGEFEAALEAHLIYSKMQEDFVKIQQSRLFLDLEIKSAVKEKQKEIEQLTKENEYQALLLEKSDQIEKQNQELIQINEDLRQFAYVASHDLKEPLRMIGSYVQILQRLYAQHFDADANTYFGYITEGVSRMNNLLDALLKYATVGRSEEEIEELDLEYIVEVCKINLQVLIKETGAVIRAENLPRIFAPRSLLIQLIQNLLSNAIKFRKSDTTPEIKITAREDFTTYTITVSDNGIGINPDHQERIFVIFQRLHPRAQYEGTGIGLAICQKIVQRFGGNIWVESEEGQGARFSFTIPKS